VTAVLNAAQGSMEDWNYVNTGPAYYQAVGMGMYGQANLKIFFKLRELQILWFFGSFRYPKSANFFGVPVSKSQIHKFSRLFCKSQICKLS
jgi:hypothetical protein